MFFNAVSRILELTAMMKEVWKTVIIRPSFPSEIQSSLNLLISVTFLFFLSEWSFLLTLIQQSNYDNLVFGPSPSRDNPIKKKLRRQKNGGKFPQ